MLVPGTVMPAPTITMITPTWWYLTPRGLNESVKNICGQIGILVYFKGRNTIRSPLVAPKDRHNITQQRGLVYRYNYDRLECYEEYIGEHARTFWERLKEDLRAPFPIYDHANSSGHHTKLDNFSIVVSKSHTITRAIKEAMFIRVSDPSFNRNIAKYLLLDIWDEVLLNTPDLHLK